MFKTMSSFVPPTATQQHSLNILHHRTTLTLSVFQRFVLKKQSDFSKDRYRMVKYRHYSVCADTEDSELCASVCLMWIDLPSSSVSGASENCNSHVNAAYGSEDSNRFHHVIDAVFRRNLSD